MGKEIWRSVKGYEDLYEVSNIGRVRSLDRVIRMRYKSGKFNDRSFPGMIRKNILNEYGYYFVRLCDHGKENGHLVHRLVAQAFLGNPPDGKDIVNHKNGIRTDNSVENLEWCNKSENALHAINILKVSWGDHCKGEKNPKCKLTDQDVLDIRQLSKSGATNTALAKRYAVSQQHISRIVLRQRRAYL